jgi:hypothetical protein
MTNNKNLSREALMEITAAQAFEWVKTGFWNKANFLSWFTSQEQLVENKTRYFG